MSHSIIATALNTKQKAREGGDKLDVGEEKLESIWKVVTFHVNQQVVLSLALEPNGGGQSGQNAPNKLKPTPDTFLDSSRSLTEIRSYCTSNKNERK